MGSESEWVRVETGKQPYKLLEHYYLIKSVQTYYDFTSNTRHITPLPHDYEVNEGHRHEEV